MNCCLRGLEENTWELMEVPISTWMSDRYQAGNSFLKVLKQDVHDEDSSDR